MEPVRLVVNGEASDWTYTPESTLRSRFYCSDRTIAQLEQQQSVTITSTADHRKSVHFSFGKTPSYCIDSG